MVFIINLNTTIDKTLIINDFKIDNVFRPEEVIEVGGGKGINVARVLNALNIPNTVVGFVGGGKTNTILSTLQKENINFVPVPIHRTSRTCSLIIDKKNRTETVINENGPKIIKQELNLFLKMFYKVFSEKIRYLVISGSMPPGVPFDLYAKLIKYAKEHNVFTVIDSSKKSFNQAIKTGPDIIKPNVNEVKELLNINEINNQVLKQTLFNFHNRGIKYPIITLGKKGSMAFNPEVNKIIKVIPPKITKLSTIGSGDSFTAGLVYSLINNYSFEDALRMATASAAANALKIGAGRLDKRDIFRLFKKTKVS